MKYLLYKDYESGFGNEIIAVELAVGIAYLTQRKLVYYGSIGEEKKLIHVRGGNYGYVPENRRGIINNDRFPTILELLDDLPVETVDYLQFDDDFKSHNLSIHSSNVRLVNAVFVPNNLELNAELVKDFADERIILKDVEEDVLQFTECNLGYYSRFFYLPDPSFYQVMNQVRLKPIYRNLGDKISQQLGKFNGIHVRLTDFRNFLPQQYQGDYPQTVLDNIKNIFPPEELLVICTDESENKDFFRKITDVYQNHLFIDELVINDFKSDFLDLPFTDEMTLGVICNTAMCGVQRFAGTPGSTYSGRIHRHWYGRQMRKELDIKGWDFKYVTSGSADPNVKFKDGSYIKNKLGFFTWNRIYIPLHTETKSWYREWPESIMLEI